MTGQKQANNQTRSLVNQLQHASDGTQSANGLNVRAGLHAEGATATGRTFNSSLNHRSISRSFMASHSFSAGYSSLPYSITNQPHVSTAQDLLGLVNSALELVQEDLDNGFLDDNVGDALIA